MDRHAPIFKFAGSLVLLSMIVFMPFVSLAAVTGDSSAIIAYKDKKIQVILVNFSNEKSQPVDPRELQNQLFYGTGSLSDYFKQSSYGKAGLSGKVLGWYTLAMPQTCLPTQVFTAAIEAARSAGNSIDANEPLVVIAPFGPGYCGWVGYSAGYQHLIAVSTASPNIVGAIAHELGHDLGLLHASAYDCGGASFSSASCKVDEYGDIFDIMGKNTPDMEDFNAAHKEYLGWLSPGNIQTVKDSGTFTLEPVENSSDNLKVLKIPRKSNEYLYVEYRQSANFNRGVVKSGNNSRTGVLLHTAVADTPKTYLINPVSSSGSAVLSQGEKFIDPMTGSSISVVSQNTGSLTVQVTLGSRVWAFASNVSFARLPSGFALPSGSLALDKGTVYIIQGQNKRAFSSMAALTGLGFDASNAISADLSSYSLKQPPITTAQVPHPPGTWILSGKTVYYVSETGLIPVPSWQVFLENGGTEQMLVKANSRDLKILKAQKNITPMVSGDARL